MSETIFETMTVHYMARLLKANYSDLFGAMKALGLRGHMVRGERVWTQAEYQRIRAHLNK